MDKIKTIKVKNEDGSISEESYSIAADALNIDMVNGKNVQETIGTIDVDKDGDIAAQLNKKINKSDIIDNLDSSDNNKVLSAKQGKVLGDVVTVLNTNINKKIYYFNTVADMKANEDLVAGDTCQTLGYHSVNDGGAGLYQIINDNTLVDDRINVHELANHLKAKLITFNLLEFDEIVNNYNVFDLAKCEYRYSPNYNISDNTINYTNSEDFLTLIIPNPKHGKIRISKLFLETATPIQTQLYSLYQDFTVRNNIVTSQIMSVTEFPTTVGIFTVYENYIEINCDTLISTIEYFLLTFPTENVDNIFIYYINAYAPEWVNSNNLLAKNIDIVLNKKFKVVKNMNLLFYPQNFTRYGNTNNISLIRLNGLAKYNLKNCLIAKTSSVQNSYDASIDYYFNDLINCLSKTINIQVLDDNVGSGLTKNVMFIGDSLTAYYTSAITQKVISLFENDVMNVNFLGTLNNAEGRSGWRAYTYCNCEYGSEDGSSGVYQGINPFYNPGGGSFDFSYYMTQQNYSNIDYVFINLGTNDITKTNHNSETEILSYYNTMINSIKAYNQNVKIGIWLHPGKGIKNNTSNLLTRDKMLEMNKILIENFENREDENLFLIPINVCLNPDADYNTETINISENETYETITDYTHPKMSGFNKIRRGFILLD